MIGFVKMAVLQNIMEQWLWKGNYQEGGVYQVFGKSSGTLMDGVPYRVATWGVLLDVSL